MAMHTADEILAIFDASCATYAFPMLDNGYVSLAATRLTLFRSSIDWAVVFEVFGFSPRTGLPDLRISTFASTLHHRDSAANYVSDDVYRQYLRNHPHDDFRSFHPIADGPWIDGEMVSEKSGVELAVRGVRSRVPTRHDYAVHQIELCEPDRVHVFELCRYLAAVGRDAILATPDEQRVSVLPDMQKLLELDEWHHPDVASGEHPSELESFKQLAAVLASADVSLYRPKALPNTHWRNWPDGGML